MKDANPNYAELWEHISAELTELLPSLRVRVAELKSLTKDDGSPFSEADQVVQDRLVGILEDFEPKPRILSEEGLNTTGESAAVSGPIWVIDPIDGTSEFLRGGVQYCSTVTAFIEGLPCACLVFCPQLGSGGGPIEVRLDGPDRSPQINGSPASLSDAARKAGLVSATRSRRDCPRSFEDLLRSEGSCVKTRPSSLTLDMVRSCLDISDLTGLPSFRWFYRHRQWIWDAAPGLALAKVCGIEAVDLKGTPVIPIHEEVFECQQPLLEDCLVVAPASLAQILLMLQGED